MQDIVEISKIKELLKNVHDPEIPVLTIEDLGILGDIRQSEDGIEIDITPTYSGCPAMNTIQSEIRMLMSAEGIPAKVNLVLSPAWSTDRMSEDGKRKLKEYGIAPPKDEEINIDTLFGHPEGIECPLCGSKNTEMVSLFGSTACKALYKCKDCLEPFDYFKCLK